MTSCHGLLAELPASPRIAVVRALQLGDLLCAVPALRALRASRPDAEITFIGLPWSAEFVRRFSRAIDRFLEFPGYPGIPEAARNAGQFRAFQQTIARDPFDLAIQIHGSGRCINDFLAEIAARRIAGFVPSAQTPCDRTAFLTYPDDVPEVHRHLRLMEHLGAPSQGFQLEFPFFERDEAAFRELIAAYDMDLDNYVCLHPGARWPSRRWLCGRFAAVGDALSDQGQQVVLTGSAWEAELVHGVSRRMRSPHVNLAGETDLGLAARVIAGARLLISNDTGVSHIAAAVRTPSVVIVLGSDAGRWAPLDRDLHRVVRAHVNCQPCEHRDCPIGHDCAWGVSASQVLQAARSCLDRVAPVGALWNSCSPAGLLSVLS